MPYRLGVDLGTTFTAAAVAEIDTPGSGPAPVEMVGLWDRALQVPSVVYLQDDGTFLCGEAAERRARVDPDRAVREFKRRLGDTVPILVGGQPFSPQALSARLLAWVVATTTERRGGPPQEVVLTHPANWGGFKQELFAQVAQLADLPSVLTCTEPEAAATQYAARAALSPGDRVAVYDLGGGTFDVCVLRREASGFTILGTPQGVEHLGGMDFDEAVFRHVLGELGDAVLSLDQEDPLVVAGLASLRRECVEAKEALSSDVEARVPVGMPGLPASVRLTRPELEDLVRPALVETLAATQRALRSASTEPGDLAAVVLVGGSSRIPLVSQMVQAELGVPTAMDTHPKHDIALGAAQYTGAPVTLAAAPRPGPAPAPAPEPSPIEAAGATAVTRELPPAQDQPPAPGPAADPAPAFVPDTARERPVGPAHGRPPRALPFGLHPRTALLAVGGVAAVVLGVIVAVSLWPSGGGDGTDKSGDGGEPSAGILDADELVVPVGSAGTGDLLVVGPDGGRGSLFRGGTPEGADPTWPSLGPGEEAVYFVQEGDTGSTHHLLRDREGEPEDALATPLLDLNCPTRPAWDPTADQVALLCYLDPEGNRRGVYLLEVDEAGRLRGGTAQVLDEIDPSVRAISFSADGTLVMTWRGSTGRGVEPGLRTVDPDGAGEAVPLTDQLDTNAAAHPGSDQVAFVRDGDLYGLALDGSFRCPPDAPVESTGDRELCRLTETEAVEADPAWSPDGERIAFLREKPEGGGLEVVVLDLDTGDEGKPWYDGDEGPVTGTIAWSAR
jgi:actin-like ATPase involved in cell morphogenesis